MVPKRGWMPEQYAALKKGSLNIPRSFIILIIC